LDTEPVAARARPLVVTGEYACRGCGYRILRSGSLPSCPMCHERAWRLVAWHPFTRPGRLDRGSADAPPEP
jgi:hypothetical protein